MDDPFIDLIAAEIVDMGYTVKTQLAPRAREYDVSSMPFVSVSPLNIDEVKYMAFGEKNLKSIYDCQLIQNTEDLNTPHNGTFDFCVGMIDNFMPPPTSLTNAGAWQVRARRIENVDRSKIPEQYSVSTVRVAIDWIMDNRA